MPRTDIPEQVAFSDFLSSFTATLNRIYDRQDDTDILHQQRGFDPQALKEIMLHDPLSVAIPTAYGGRGANARECLGILEAAAYQSLPLSLTFGINMALFLAPVAKYAREPVKQGIFDSFLHQQSMGGLMITEPDYGSDALNMQTFNVREGRNYHVKGIKHWQGLTGMADYWLITSRRKVSGGELARDIDFFICDVREPGQQIHVEEYYNNIGLQNIPYGRNRVDIHVPEEFKLEANTTGLKLLMDLLHRSRFQFPGMGVGFIKRILDEAIQHCQSRIISGRPLISLDQVQHQISRIQSAFTICSALSARSAAISGIGNDLVPASLEANSMKAYVTDLMQESAQTLTQLNGANGYKAENLGSRGIVDSRPFQIFEGSNEMLYTQVSDIVLKSMKRQKMLNLSEFFMKSDLTKNVAEQFRSALNFSVNSDFPQRKMVDIGKIIARVLAAGQVAELGAKGFRPDFISSSIDTIRQEIAMLVSSYQYQTEFSPIEEFSSSASWMEYC